MIIIRDDLCYFLHKNVCCDFLSELSHQGSSDEESQHILKETSKEKSELVLLEWTLVCA